MDRKAEFRRLIQQHYRALYRHAYWLVGDPELAADLVQETYCQAWRGFRGLRDAERGLGWLLAILRRNAFREYGHRDRGARRLDETVADTVPDAHVDQDRLLDLAAALARLTMAQRDLLLLYALHGLSYEQIGRQLEIPVGTVMSRLSRARRALRAALEARPRRRKLVVLPGAGAEVDR